MLVEGIWLYLMIVRVFESGHSRMKKYSASAWGKLRRFIQSFFQQFDGASVGLCQFTLYPGPDPLSVPTRKAIG